MSVKFEIQDRQLLANLFDLEPKVRKQVMRKAIRVGLKLTLAEARRRVPVGKGGEGRKPGALKRSIKIRTPKGGGGRNKYRVKLDLSTSGTDSLFQGDQFYGAFQEFGWKPRGRRTQFGKSAVAHRSAKGGVGAPVPGKHYMQGAFEATDQQALAAILREMAAGLEGVAARLPKGAR